jgi:hypothetical protein
LGLGFWSSVDDWSKVLASKFQKAFLVRYITCTNLRARLMLKNEQYNVKVIEIKRFF